MADELAERFYQRLFADYPELQIHFRDTDFADQRQKLVGGLSAIVRLLDNETALVQFLTR